MSAAELAEIIKTTSAGILAALAIYTGYRLARSKQQIARVYRDLKAVYVVNAGETAVFVETFGAVGPWGKPLEFVMLPDLENGGRIDPGQRLKLWISPHGEDPPGAAKADHVWVELQSGARVTSHGAWDPRRILAKVRRRKPLVWS